MEKSNGKVIAIVALVVAVVALSVGFAAFSDQLTISGSATLAKPEDTVFAPNFGYAETPAAECHVTGSSTSVGNAGTASGNTWSNISVPLTMTASSVTCTATVENTSAYDAFLKTISVTGPIQCTSTGADAATNTTNVCSGVSASVQIGESSSNLLEFNSATVNNYSMNASLTIGKTSGKAVVTVIVAYDTDNATPDGDVTITLPTITHSYSTAG